MRCNSVRKHIQSLVMGELDSATAARILEHIESCAECANEKTVYERLIADLSTPHPMATMPECLGELHITDEQPRRKPVIGFAVMSVSVVALAMILFLSAHKQPAQIATAPRQQVARTQASPVATEPTPLPSPIREIERKVATAPKRNFHQNVVAERYIVPRIHVKEQPKPSNQLHPVMPDAHQPEPDLAVVAQAPEVPSRMDLEVTDQTTGRTYIERRVGVGPVCSALIE